MLEIFKLIAELAAGATLGVAVFDAVLHSILIKRDPKSRKRHLSFVILRVGFAIVFTILEWYVVIPAPIEAWDTPQSWGFIVGLLMLSVGIFAAATYTYDEFAEKTEAPPSRMQDLEGRMDASEKHAHFHGESRPEEHDKPTD